MNEEKHTAIKMKDFKLPNKKIKITPIRRKGTWLPETHAASFLFKEAGVRYCVPITESRNVPIEILTQEEKEFLSKELRVDLSVHLPVKDNYWRNRYVKLKDEVRVFDLSKPEDFIDYKILLANKDEIAPSLADRLKKGTYRFAISDLDYEENTRSKYAQNKREANRFFTKLYDKGSVAMSDFLTAYYYAKPGKRVPENATVVWLESEIDKIIESDLNGFLAIASDPDYETKLLIGKAINKKALYKDSNRYSLPEGGLIATNLDDLLIWFKDPINSEEVTRIEAKVQ